MSSAQKKSPLHAHHYDALSKLANDIESDEPGLAFALHQIASEFAAKPDDRRGPALKESD